MFNNNHETIVRIFRSLQSSEVSICNLLFSVIKLIEAITYKQCTTQENEYLITLLIKNLVESIKLVKQKMTILSSYLNRGSFDDCNLNKEYDLDQTQKEIIKHINHIKRLLLTNPFRSKAIEDQLLDTLHHILLFYKEKDAHLYSDVLLPENPSTIRKQMPSPPPRPWLPHGMKKPKRKFQKDRP